MLVVCAPVCWPAVLLNCFPPFCPSPPLDNIRVMMIVWRLKGNIIRTALCWVVWHNIHSQQHTYMSSSYSSSRLGLSHWDPYAMRRGGCLELYYCNVVEWCWWDSSLLWKTNWFSSVPLTLLVWSWPVKTLSLYTATTTFPFCDYTLHPRYSAVIGHRLPYHVITRTALYWNEQQRCWFLSDITSLSV